MIYSDVVSNWISTGIYSLFLPYTYHTHVHITVTYYTFTFAALQTSRHFPKIALSTARWGDG